MFVTLPKKARTQPEGTGKGPGPGPWVPTRCTFDVLEKDAEKRDSEGTKPGLWSGPAGT